MSVYVNTYMYIVLKNVSFVRKQIKFISLVQNARKSGNNTLNNFKYNFPLQNTRTHTGF